MSWVQWLKDLADRRAEGADDASPPTATGSVRRPRKGGDAYAKEWVKVLEEAGPGHDPFSTYTWELHPDGSTPTPTSPAGNGPVAPPRATAPSPYPFDTYTWELQESESREDPWGLKRDDPAPEKPQRTGDGVNPYDTGVFVAGWTGRFDQR